MCNKNGGLFYWKHGNSTPGKRWTSYTWEDPVTVGLSRAFFLQRIGEGDCFGFQLYINLNENSRWVKRFDTRAVWKRRRIFLHIRFDPEATTAFRETMVVN